MSTLQISNQTQITMSQYMEKDAVRRTVMTVSSLGDEQVTVTNTGVVDSGKSSLFNALLGNKSDNVRFPVGAARTTMSRDS